MNGKRTITKREWCLGRAVEVFQEGKSDQLCQILTDNGNKDSEVTVAFGHTNVTGEFDRSILSKGA